MTAHVQGSCTVYALASSEAPDVFHYIGQTVHVLYKRLAKHLWEARHRGIRNAELANWMRSVEASGFKVVIIPLIHEAVPDVVEQRMIAEYRAKGHPLLNMTAGGAGAPLLGARRPSTVYKKLWATRRANGNAKHSDETRAKMSESQRKRCLSPEQRERLATRLRDARKNQKFGPLSEEHKRKVSESLKGKPKTPEHIAAAAAARRGIPVTDEVREIRRLTQRRRWSHIDWDGMEKAVRETPQSYSAIAVMFSVSPECVRKRSIKGGWRG